MDGEEWSPPPGKCLDDDDLELRSKKNDAKKCSNVPLTGNALWRGSVPLEKSEERAGARSSVEEDVGANEGRIPQVVEKENRREESLSEAGGGLTQPPDFSAGSPSALCSLAGLSYGRSGPIFSELWTMCLTLSLSHCKAQPIGEGIFPLPTVHVRGLDHLVAKYPAADVVFFNMCRGLNSLAGWGLGTQGKEVSVVQREALEYLFKHADRVNRWSEKFDDVSWEKFFQVRGVDYKGDEVLTAHSIAWCNIAPALPLEVGTVDLEEVVTLGTRFYVENFEDFLVPEEDMVPVRPPKVMVAREDWEELARGLVDRGICEVIGEDDVYKVKGQPLLNGLFGVTKHEWEGNVEIHRLIMNLIPVNSICRGVEGDVSTLPSLSGLAPIFLGKEERLLVSSEDVRCFFYIFKIPVEWRRFMAFNKPLPPALCPANGRCKRYYLCAKVLPMGFRNSVSIAQNVHRTLIRLAGRRGGILGDSSSELRKDRPFSFANPLVRVYLDNYDQLSRVDAKTAAMVEGTPTVETLSLRSEYESWGVPNHPKKSVTRKSLAEVQGAIVDGTAGIAFPKKEKVLKYTHPDLPIDPCFIRP